MQGFPVTFDTPCNLVRFPANEPLQCVSSVANILLGSCNGAAVKHHENLASLLQLAVASASTWVELQGGGPAQFFPNKLRLGKIWLNGWLSGNVLGWRKFPNSSVKSSRTQLKYHSNVRNTVQEYKATHMDWKNFWKQERSLQHRALGNVAVHQIYLSTHHVHANHLEKSAKEIPILDWVSQ